MFYHYFWKFVTFRLWENLISTDQTNTKKYQVINNEEFEPKNMRVSIKHEGAMILVWDCLWVPRVDNLAITNRIII